LRRRLHDGSLASEACSWPVRSAWQLILFYDDNDISIEGNTDIAFREDVGARFKAYGWQVIHVDDGNDVLKIPTPSARPKRKPANRRSSLLRRHRLRLSAKMARPCARRTAGRGQHQGRQGIFGLAVGRAVLCARRSEKWQARGCPRQKGAEAVERTVCGLRRKYPELAKQWETWHSDKIEPRFPQRSGVLELWPQGGDPQLLREVLARIAKYVPNLMGGSATWPRRTKPISRAAAISAEDYSG
jgi:transketolase